MRKYIGNPSGKADGAIRRIAAFIAIIAMVFIAVLGAYPASASEGGTEGGTSYKYNADSSGGTHVWTRVSENEWTMDFDGDGNADITLTASVDDSGNDVWTYKFAVEDDEQDYYVYEKMLGLESGSLADGYTARGTDGKTGVDADPGKLSKDDSTHTYTITNTKNHTPKGTGSLVLEKKVTGTMPAEGQKFSFTITLSGSTDALKKQIEGSKVFGGTPFMDGVANVSLGKDESVEITGLPDGIKYSIKETTDSDWYSIASKTNDTGTITKDTTVTSTFTNTSSYTPPSEKDVASFTITKTVTGGAAPEGTEYKFLITLEGLSPEAEYTYTTGDTETASYTADANGKASVTFMLADGGSASFTGIPAGTIWQAMEYGEEYDWDGNASDGEFIPSAAISGAGETDGSVTGTAGESLSAPRVTAASGSSATATFTNNYPQTQKLTVRKKVTLGSLVLPDDLSGEKYQALDDTAKSFADRLADTEFPFTITFSNLTSAFNSDIGRVVPDEDGECIKTFTLKADGTPLVFDNIPAGTVWQIEEGDADDFDVSYTVTAEDRTGAEITGAVDSPSGNGTATATESLDPGENDTAVFTNNTASLTVSKTVKGNLGNRHKKFSFHVSIKKGEIGISGTYPCTGDLDQITFTDGKADFTLAHGETFTINGLPAGYSYTAAEDDYSKDGYETTSENAEGVTAADNPEASFVNSNGVTIPTGRSIGTTVFYVFGTATIACAATIVIKKRRKKD